MPEEDQPRFSARMLLRLMGEYRPDRSLAVLTGVIAVATALAELLPSLFTRNAINHIENRRRARGPHLRTGTGGDRQVRPARRRLRA